MNGGGAFLAEKYKTIFNATNDTLLLLDTETGKILDINDAGLRLYNFQREDVVNISLSELELGRSLIPKKTLLSGSKRRKNLDRNVLNGMYIPILRIRFVSRFLSLA